jgi:hypothetical protein
MQDWLPLCHDFFLVVAAVGAGFFLGTLGVQFEAIR